MHSMRIIMLLFFFGLFVRPAFALMGKAGWKQDENDVFNMALNQQKLGQDYYNQKAHIPPFYTPDLSQYENVIAAPLVSNYKEIEAVKKQDQVQKYADVGLEMPQPEQQSALKEDGVKAAPVTDETMSSLEKEDFSVPDVLLESKEEGAPVVKSEMVETGEQLSPETDLVDLAQFEEL